MKMKRSWKRKIHFFVRHTFLEKENVGKVCMIYRKHVVAAWYEPPLGGHYHLPIDDEFMDKFNACEHWIDAVQLLRSEGLA